jgi:hypothetical protein
VGETVRDRDNDADLEIDCVAVCTAVVENDSEDVGVVVSDFDTDRLELDDAVPEFETVNVSE